MLKDLLMCGESVKASPFINILWMSVGFLVKPPTRRGASEALEKISGLRPQALLLGLPRSLEDLVRELVEGRLGYDDFVDEVLESSSLPEPRRSWIIEYEEILRNLSRISEPNIYCYGSSRNLSSRMELDLKLASLTLRSLIKGEVDVHEWLKILKLRSDALREAFQDEVKYIDEAADIYDRLVCVAGFQAKNYRRALMEKHHSWIRYLGQPYHFPPLEVLTRILMRRGGIDEEEARSLIEEHLKFVRDYLYLMPLPDALEMWSARKLYWMRRS